MRYSTDMDQVNFRTTGSSQHHSEDGVVFMRQLASAPNCWILTTDHRVFHIYRLQHRDQLPRHGGDLFPDPDPSSPNNGVA